MLQLIKLINALYMLIIIIHSFWSKFISF